MSEVFAGGAELVHVALCGKSMVGDSGKVSPRFFPVLIAVADRMARRRIGRAALARMHAHHRVGHPGFDGHHRVLNHGDGRRAAEGKIRGVVGTHTRHVRHPNRVTSMRVVERLVGDEPVHVGRGDTGVVKASFDAFQVE